MKKPVSLFLVAGLASVVAFGTLAAGSQDTGKGRGPATTKQTEGGEHKERAAGDKKTEKAAAKAEIGKPAPAFTLTTTDGKQWSLADAAGKIVVLEWCNPNCPVCRKLVSNGAVAKTVADCGTDVVYVMINSSAADPASLEATAAYLKDNKLTTPGLLDKDGAVGKLYGARTTPHCFVIDAKGVLRYQGAIDDNADGKGGKMNYVANAVKQIKGNETVSPETTKPYGCSVKY